MHPIKMLLLLSYVCVASASAAIITPALPQIQQSFQLSHGLLEWTVTGFLIGYMAGQLIYGPLANRYGRLSALRIGFTVNIIGILICLAAVYTHSFSWLLIGRIITALGAAAGLVCTFILIKETLAPAQAKRALSFAVVAFTAGIGIAVLLAALITQYLRWEDIFWVLLIHGVLILSTTWYFSETLVEKQSIHALTLLKNYVNLFKNRCFITFAIIFSLNATFSYCYSAAAPLIAENVLHITTGKYGAWNLVSILGMTLGGFSAAWLLGRYKVKSIMTVAFYFLVFCAINLLLFSLSHSTSALWFFLTSAAIYFFVALTFPCASHLILESVDDKANASAAMNFINVGSAALNVGILGYLPFTRVWAFSGMFFAFLIICILLWLSSKKAVAKLNA